MKCEDCGMYLHPDEIHGSDDCIDKLCERLHDAMMKIDMLEGKVDSLQARIDNLDNYDW